MHACFIFFIHFESLSQSLLVAVSESSVSESSVSESSVSESSVSESSVSESSVSESSVSESSVSESSVSESSVSESSVYQIKLQGLAESLQQGVFFSNSIWSSVVCAAIVLLLQLI